MENETQLIQTGNIISTLIEATDHFTQLIKNKELQHSLYIFSSIVEGTQAIFQHASINDVLEDGQSDKYLTYLSLLADALEKGRYTKVLEIIQFSLRPLFVKTKEQIDSSVTNEQEPITIGLYHRTNYPHMVMTKDRLHATIEAAKQQDVTLYSFTEKDVSLADKKIAAYIYEDGGWQQTTVPFPKVISNIGVGKANALERKLQRMVPFTNTSFVGNKFSLPKRLLQSRKFTELLVPFTVCISEQNINQFMEKNPYVVFKALGSNRGENIYFVQQKGSRYILLDQVKERILTEEEFHSFITKVILAEMGSYIIQRYVHTRTKEDEPYHFRSHVQKNESGAWQITYIYPRIGNKRSNLSNISTEGRIEDFSTFLREQYGDKQSAMYEKEILRLSMDVTLHLDKLYGLSLNELGLDFAIDDQGRIWMHEANNGPQTAYHEEERAIHYIGYAKYIANNGIMHMSNIDKMRLAKGAFQAKNSELPVVGSNWNNSVGLLIPKKTPEKIVEAFKKVAISKQIPLSIFTEHDVDPDFEVIRALIYQEGVWQEYIAPYPSIVIDLANLRNVENQPFIYEDLSDIPFTNDWDKHRMTKDILWQELKNIASFVSPTRIVQRPLHLFHALDKTNTVFLQPIAYTSKADTLTICVDQENKRYLVTRENGTEKVYTENELRNYLQFLIDKETYIVHEGTNKEEIEQICTVHLVKTDMNKWQVINEATHAKAFKNISLIIEEVISVYGDMKVNELELKCLYRKNGDIIVYGINPSGPNKIKNKETYAEALLTYAKRYL